MIYNTKVTSKGQVTIPVEIMVNSSMDAFREAQRAFAGEAERVGLKNDDDVMAMIKELREESAVK